MRDSGDTSYPVELFQPREIRIFRQPELLHTVHVPVVVHKEMPGQYIQRIGIVLRMCRCFFPGEAVGKVQQVKLAGPVAHELFECGRHVHARRGVRLFLIPGREEWDKLRAFL